MSEPSPPRAPLTLLIGRTREDRRQALKKVGGLDRFQRPDFLYITATRRKAERVRRSYWDQPDKPPTFLPAVIPWGELRDDLAERWGCGRAQLDPVARDLLAGQVFRGIRTRCRVWRGLEDSPATHAPADRDIILSGKVVRAPDGTALRVHSDPLETSIDGKWLYFAALEGPWYKVETRLLNDAALAPESLSASVQFWRDLPPVGGTAMDKQGNFYFSDLATDTLKRISVSGDIESIVSDPALHWVDAPAFDPQGRIYLPAAQVDRVGLFNGGTSKVQWPLKVFRLEVSKPSTR